MALIQCIDQGAIAVVKARYLQYSFTQTITTKDTNEGITLYDFW